MQLTTFRGVQHISCQWSLTHRISISNIWIDSFSSIIWVPYIKDLGLISTKVTKKTMALFYLSYSVNNGSERHPETGATVRDFSIIDLIIHMSHMSDFPTVTCQMLFIKELCNWNEKSFNWNDSTFELAGFNIHVLQRNICNHSCSAGLKNNQQHTWSRRCL